MTDYNFLEPDSPVTLDFKINHKDLAAFNTVLYKNNPTRTLGFVILISLIILSTSIYGSISELDQNAFVTSMVAFAIGYVILHKAFANIIYKKCYPKDSLIMQEQHYIFNSEGVVCETSKSRSEFKWSVVNKIVKTDAHIFLFISPVIAHVIPLRGGQEEINKEYIYKKINNFYNESKKGDSND